MRARQLPLAGFGWSATKAAQYSSTGTNSGGRGLRKARRNSAYAKDFWFGFSIRLWSGQRYLSVIYAASLRQLTECTWREGKALRALATAAG